MCVLVGIKKKIDEITTLCGIEACVIFFSPKDPQPEVFPTSLEAHKVLSRFKETLEYQKNMLYQESFLKEKISIAQEKLTRQLIENRKKEIELRMFEYLSAGQIFGNVSMTDLNDISCLIDQKLKETEQKIIQIQAGEEYVTGAEIASGGLVNGA